MKALENDEKCFLFHDKLSLFLRYLILSWIFGHVVKRRDKKAKVNFKIYTSQPVVRLT